MTKARSPSLILFVDDDRDLLKLYDRLLTRDPVIVLKALSGLHALDLLRARHTAETPVRVVVSDQAMAGMTGVDLLDTIADLYPEIGRILLTGQADSELVLEARRHKLLTKGMDLGLIRNAILRELKRHGG